MYYIVRDSDGFNKHLENILNQYIDITIYYENFPFVNKPDSKRSEDIHAIRILML
jgi:hypothetical protein